MNFKKSFLFALFACLSIKSLAVEPRIEIPVRFHIVSGLSMEKNGLVMSSWVTRQDIQTIVLPEVNRIWQSAGIVFNLENILETKALNPPDRAKLIDGIVQARREASGKSDSARIKKLNRLIDWSMHSPNAINIYLVPYLGEASQGNANRKKLRIFVGQWSDKASKGRENPQKFKLTEQQPFTAGSLSRTTAHEIGHILGLKHPDKQSQVVLQRLMGGRRVGYTLTQDEIVTARQGAAKLNSRFAVGDY